MTYFYGLSPDEIGRMTVKSLKAYVDHIPMVYKTFRVSGGDDGKGTSAGALPSPEESLKQSLALAGEVGMRVPKG